MQTDNSTNTDKDTIINQPISTSDVDIEYLMKKKKNSLPVLIVDDDKWIHRLVGQYLKSWGFSTTYAFDAVQGLAQACNSKPLLILLDIIMPDVKGDIVLKMLKSIETTKEVPIIIMSGNLNKELLGKTFRDGASSYISKPFTMPVLFEKMYEAHGKDLFEDFTEKDAAKFKEFEMDLSQIQTK